jgi:hypothetical protein
MEAIVTGQGSSLSDSMHSCYSTPKTTEERISPKAFPLKETPQSMT